MKILILANSSAGLYSFREKLIRELLQENEIFVITPDSGNCEALKRIGCKLIITPIDRRGLNPIRDLKLMLNYFKQIKAINPELVITYTIKPNIYGGLVCRLLRIPYAINITGLGTAFQKDNWLKKIIICMYKLACKRAKVVFFENSVNRQVFLDNKIVSLNQTCLLNGAGVNLQDYSITEYPKGEVAKFLFIGRVMEEKGINELLYAMKMLIEEGISVELHVVGRCEEDSKTSFDAYNKEPWLYYHGYQENVRPFIQESHCFVLPSWHEGMANTNLECAASGRPVITSNIPGCREAVINGVSGYLVESKNAEDLYRKMRLFLELTYEERSQMGVQGRKHMEALFDKNIVVEDTIKGLNQ